MMENNRNFQDKLKSLYHYEEVLDKKKSWEALEHRMDKKKKKRFIFWCIFGLIVLSSATMTYYIFESQGQTAILTKKDGIKKSEIQNKPNTTIVEESKKQMAAEQSIIFQKDPSKSQKSQESTNLYRSSIQNNETPNRNTSRLFDETLNMFTQSTGIEYSTENFSNDKKSSDGDDKFPFQALEKSIRNSLVEEVEGELDRPSDIALIGHNQLFIESEQSRYMDLNIKPISTVKLPLILSSYVMIGKPRSLVENQSYGETNFTRSNTETPLEYFGFGVDAHWFITKKLLFTTGLQYLQINEVFEYKNKLIRYGQDDNQAISIYEKSSGETEAIVGSLTTFQSIEINKKKYNSFNQFNLMLGLGYELCNFRKFAIRASSGFSIPVYQLYQGEILGFDSRTVRIENTLEPTKLNPMIYHEGSFNYRVTNNFILSLSGIMQYHITSIHKNSNYSSQKFLLYGLKLGPIYNF